MLLKKCLYKILIIKLYIEIKLILLMNYKQDNMLIW